MFVTCETRIAWNLPKLEKVFACHNLFDRTSKHVRENQYSEQSWPFNRYIMMHLYAVNE